MRPLFLIERDRELLELFRDIFEEGEHRVHAFERGKDALSALAQLDGPTAEGVVFADDASIDDLDGFCGQLRVATKTAALPIVLMSTRPAAAEAVPRLSLAGFLAKPFDLVQLLDVAARLAGDPGRPELPNARELTAKLRDFYDCAPELAAQLAADAARTDEWTTQIAPGVRIRPVSELPPKPAREAALVHVAAGHTYPFHPHARRERLLCLRGGFRDSDGSSLWAGESAVKPKGSAHALATLAGQDCVVAALVDD